MTRLSCPASVLTCDVPLEHAGNRDGYLSLYGLDARDSATLYAFLQDADFLLDGDRPTVAYPGVYFDGRTLVLETHRLPGNTLYLTDDDLHEELRANVDHITIRVAPLALRLQAGTLDDAFRDARRYRCDYLAKHTGGTYTAFFESERETLLHDATTLGFLRVVRCDHPAYALVRTLEDDETITETRRHLLVFVEHRELFHASMDADTQICRMTDRQALALLQLGDWGRGLLYTSGAHHHVTTTTETLFLFRGYLEACDAEHAPHTLTRHDLSFADGCLALGQTEVVS